MDNKNDSRKHLYKAGIQSNYFLALGFLLVVCAVGIVCAAGNFNPDSDSYWLVGTGRWIFEHGKVPYTNPWTYTEGLSVIVQQPICALLNYFWFRYFGGFGNMWILACLENMVLLLSVFYLAGKFSENKADAILAAGFTETILIISELITTRPYQLTIAAMAILIANLEESYRGGKHRRAVIAVLLITLWQANYQMASLFMIPCFISCYFVGSIVEKVREGHIKVKSLKDIAFLKDTKYLAWGLPYLAWFLAGLVNPYGIHGMLYLVKSAKAMRLVGERIVEMQALSTTSFSFLLVMITLLMFLYRVLAKKNWTAPEAFLVTGTAFASFLAVRNIWMSILAFTVSYPLTIRIGGQESDAQKKSLLRIFSIGIFILGILSVPFSLYNAALFSESSRDPMGEMAAAVRSLPEESKLYTSFNTGGIAEYAGHKIYMDARPELYSSAITGGPDLLQDWVDFELEDTEFLPMRVNEAEWQYYLVDVDTQLCHYLEYSGAGEMICWSGDMKLFKFIPGKDTNVNYGQKVL